MYQISGSRSIPSKGSLGRVGAFEMEFRYHIHAYCLPEAHLNLPDKNGYTQLGESRKIFGGYETSSLRLDTYKSIAKSNDISNRLEQYWQE